MNWLLTILLLGHTFRDTVSNVPENNNQWLNLVSKTYYLKKLTQMEVTFAQNFELVTNSLATEGKKLAKAYMEEFMRANENLTGFSLTQDIGASVEAILHNPIATFHIVRRFRKELLNLKEYLLKVKSPFCKLLESEQWFTTKDVEQTMNNLIQISQVHNFKISDVADGIFQDIHTGTKLNAKDCSDIGRAAPKFLFYAQSILFLEEALERVEDGSVDRVLVEQYLNATIALHDKRLKTAEPEVEIYFFNRKIGQIRKRYPDQYKWMRTPNRLMTGQTARELDLCVFGSLQDETVKKDLFCWFERTMDPYFTINPLKMEVLSLKPELIQVYEIVGEQQIKFIEEQFDHKSLWNDTNVYDRLTFETALIDESKHVELETIPKTLEKLTGLNFVAPGASRSVRVNTYFPGGQFTPHYDLFPSVREGIQNLMSTTFLYYVEEPLLGGATTFENAMVAVKPIKGSGILYYNYRSDWSKEPNSKHSSCPVILGRKRSAAKPTFLSEQMLTLKCNSNRVLPYKQFPKSKIYQRKRSKLLT